MQVAAPGLMQSLRDGTPLVAATPLLAAVATQAFSQFQLETKSTGWQRPHIFSLDAWLTWCWREARYSMGDALLLLSPAQELLLWENAIRAEAKELFDIGSAARAAQRTSRLAAEWHIDESDPGWSEHEDGRHYLAISGLVRALCRSKGWMTRADLWSAIPSWQQAGLCPQTALATLGFASLSPGLKALLANLPPTRHFISGEDAPSSFTPVTSKQFDNLEEELTAAARWSRTVFEQDRSSSIGIFVPQLGNNRAVVERMFRRVFHPVPSLEGPTSGSKDKAAESLFHIHASKPLWEEPLVSNALLLLQLCRGRIDIADATTIFRCPFIKGAQRERDARALADLSLRRLRELDVDLAQMAFAASKCPELSGILAEVRQLLSNKPGRAEPAQWSAFIADLLRIVGWPGDRDLTADDQDLIEGWKDVLSEFGSLSLVLPPMNLDTAIDQVRRLLGRNRTEIGDWFSPIQVIDAAGATGLSFDKAYALGMGDESWPPPSAVAALIPLQLQRAHGLPGSTPDLIRAERKRLTGALLNTASQLHVSHCGRLSPLFGAVEQPPAEWQTWGGKTPLQAFKPVKKESVQDTFAPPVVVSDNLRGGTSIIKLQSACPFRAFAEIRLRSKTPEDACFGMDAREKGSFLHAALQFVWEELRDSKTLRKLSYDALREVVERSVNSALEQPVASEFRTQTTDVERTRLTELVMTWLHEVELDRKKEWTVETTEGALEFSLAGLPMKLRIDRIDRLANGQMLLIDYKSGLVSRKKWEGDRPEEPQLLVYAAAKRTEVDGVFFGQLRSDKTQMTGISREQHFKKSYRLDTALGAEWDDRLAAWDEAVEQLAAAFMKGSAAVDPAKCACDYCDNKPLCRIREKAGMEEEGV